MINFPNESELSELRSFRDSYCVSIYVPFIEPSGATNPEQIEFKNLLRQASVALIAAGAKPKVAEDTLRPARELINSQEFWPNKRSSLAVFAQQEFFRYYHLPDSGAPHLLTIDKRFNLKPLLAAMRDDTRYYLLALSHRSVKLFEGGHYEIKRVEPKGFPSDMKATLRIDELPKWSETHTVAPTSREASEAFHGQYNRRQTDKTMLVEFFQHINKSLQLFLRGREAPLVIGGVDYLLPLYRQVNTYPYLLPEVITGNLEHIDLDELREQAWATVKEVSHG